MAGVQAGGDAARRAVRRRLDRRHADGVGDGPAREPMIALKMNDEPLPRIHGFPARLIVPGLYGYVSATKWLADLELTTLEAFNGYWVPLGWAKDGPILTQSRIDTPGDGQAVPRRPGRRSPASPGRRTAASRRSRSRSTACGRTRRSRRRSRTRRGSSGSSPGTRRGRPGPTRSRSGRPTGPAWSRQPTSRRRRPTARAATTRSRSSRRRLGALRPGRRRHACQFGRAGTLLMPRRLFHFDPPDRFVAGTIGEPGNRTFFLQARRAGQVVSRRPREGPGRGPRRAARRAPRRARGARRSPRPTDERRRPTTVAARRADQRDVPGDDADARLGRRRRADPRRGPGGADDDEDEDGRGRRSTRTTTRTRTRSSTCPAVEGLAGSPAGELLAAFEGDRRGRRRAGHLRVRLTRRGRPGVRQPRARGRRRRPACRARCAASRSIRRATSARGATATTSTERRGRADGACSTPPRRRSTSCARARSRSSGGSWARRNHAMLCRVRRPCPPPEEPVVVEAVYKPTAGERPLDDFPDETLSHREVAAFLVERGDRLGDRPADDPPRRAVRRRVAPALDRHRPDGRRRRDGRRGRPAAAPDRGLRRGGQQHGSEGRPPPADERRAHLRRRPRRHVLDGTEAADRAVGLARPAVRGRRARGAGPARATRCAATWPGTSPASCRAARSRPRGGGSTGCWRRGGSPPPPDWPAIPWPPF